ncbi:MAG TPA: cytochrome c [Burkholderiales bacterium]|nr:cytochrome c [Burkholderiales bacterium]
MRFHFRTAAAICAAAFTAIAAAHAERDSLAAPEPIRLAADDGGSAAASDGAAGKKLDVKSTFRNICGFCHENYGRKEGKGPQLMNDPNTDEYLFNRIKHGKPGRMAAWGSVFTDEQIRDIVKFIRNLKPDQEPQNP